MMDLWKKKRADHHQDHNFAELIFSWSIDDVLNDELYKYQAEKIPLTFQSEEHYFSSFVYPLLEETRTELASALEIMRSAPFSEIISLNEVKDKGKMLYDVTVGPWRNISSGRGKEPYRTLPGDLFLLMDRKPDSVTDLQNLGRTWAFSIVNKTVDDDNQDSSQSKHFKAKLSRIDFQDGMYLYAVFLMNITTQKRIWNSLHVHGNRNIIKEVIYAGSVVKECDVCSFCCSDPISENVDQQIVSRLNESQIAAIMASINKTKCCHNSSVGQIWGPPGTGKTTTVSVMLFVLLKMDCRMVACAPTNVAIVELASRVLKLVRESFDTRTVTADSFCPVGDMLLFGNMERLKVGTEIEDIYVEHRVDRLTECLGSLTGWKHCISSMIDLLENCVSQYHVFVENEFKEQLAARVEIKTNKLEVKSFIGFLRDRFKSSALALKRCILTLCTHISRSFMREDNFQNMISLLNNKSLERLGLPSALKISELKNFCFEQASLIFCTTSTSYKLYTVKMEPLNLLVIDEAAQLKEAESTIPLQLPGVNHAILIGDQCQLPATVKSKVSTESGFGRSLFERLSSIGHSKHLLNIQYRMHPSISFFPNHRFYKNQILDAENVVCESYEKRYLSGPMFGSYSFINVVGGREEKLDDGQSLRNMVEVALVMKIVQNLYRACNNTNQKLSIGVVSPYASQVVTIQEKLAHRYEKLNGFSVEVKSIDGFQGGEQDIIILSTVRSNSRGSVGFLSSLQRTNVALTRARHSLWILGNERTLASSESIWKELVCDARNRNCLFNADADECLKTTIVGVKKELDQLDDLANGNSVLFKDAKWKVLFSNDFKTSFGKLKCSRMKKQVLNLLLKLSNGWRPKSRSIDLRCENSSQIIKQFKVEELYIICTIDIIKEFKYVQILKVWNVLSLEEIPKMTKRLESIFSAYTDDYVNRCTEKCVDGNLELPRSWAASEDIIRFRKPSKCEGESEVSEGRSFVENSKVSESLLLMKFYSLSSGVVNLLLSESEVDLPMEVTDEQMDIISFSKSSFIIGRSGTGKTTILTMKLFQNEQDIRVASEGVGAAESSNVRDVIDGCDESKLAVLHQLFVTVSPKLCYAVKKQVSQYTSDAHNGNSSAENILDDADYITSESDIPDTFIGIPVKSYPLVITFHKFLMMLDGTLGNSFFKRFLEAKEGSQGDHISSRSIAMQTFIRLSEVTYDRFCSLYWPHFNSNLTKNLDPSRVFTEIISHIKGGMQAGGSRDGKLSNEVYSLLSEGRTSTLTREKREMVYTLFQAYEKMKTKRGEFDLGDFVNDIHRRLENWNYEGDQIDFVYIDEVQDLSMRQISLFKYICQNVDEGFIFAGDTAQTIARGIDFRFQDIRSLFYQEFLSNKTNGKQEKGLVTEIFQLKQNFRTHVGVLELAQSVVDILYCYFAHAVDILEPETSLISGEAPVILESGNDEIAIATIFGDSVPGENIVGFGAEQVILVRDESVKTEICKYVGKHALVLTIVECKGLEFQDVFLYNFFGSSPLKEQWRLIYGYMKERDLLEEKHPHAFPSFSEERHNVLCSELKQLYVAITRTRQRLWICEHKEEMSKPMFDYWKKMGLVQVRTLDDCVAQAMRVASSPQEWRERGKKLFYETNFVMATMCFERAGDTKWEKLAKASALRASAQKMLGTDSKAAFGYLRDAGDMFESIGKHDSAATCYCDLGNYKRAGTYKGTNLVLVGMDGNNQIIPIATGVSQGETGESWTWFLLKFKECIGKVPSLAIITDRHLEIILVCNMIFPNAFHGYCCRHLMMNCKMKSDKWKCIFWKTCKAYSPEEFKEEFLTFGG
nr:UvrD-like helicase, ATP-binding domain, P-loop containing nucleoside triphosphate hydrolase [Tanacetum cinerariifolium]